jgi:UDP-N-acetylglucosamine 4,6-dehydratase
MAGAHRTRFAVARYGNVVGSRGSVVPFFKKLLSEGAKELPVTDPRMTRFWIMLQQGVDFVLKSFVRMKGGEIFVPKIPSMRILDLVEALAPGIGVKTVGIRPGEKLHETMVPADDSHNTLEFDDHYVIRPSIMFYTPVDFIRNALGEVGVTVDQGFAYCSGTNPHFLSVEELRAIDQPEVDQKACAFHA